MAVCLPVSGPVMKRPWPHFHPATAGMASVNTWDPERRRSGNGKKRKWKEKKENKYFDPHLLSHRSGRCIPGHPTEEQASTRCLLLLFSSSDELTNSGALKWRSETRAEMAALIYNWAAPLWMSCNCVIHFLEKLVNASDADPKISFRNVVLCASAEDSLYCQPSVACFSTNLYFGRTHTPITKEKNSRKECWDMNSLVWTH